MAVTYTNRKGVTYFLCRGVTKTGKTCYFFAREPRDEPVEKIPDGYEISESVDGVVSLVKAQPALLLETEILAVKDALANHPRAKLYRVEAKARQITVYECDGTDPQDVFQRLSGRFGLPGLVDSRLMLPEFQQGERLPAERCGRKCDPELRLRRCAPGPRDRAGGSAAAREPIPQRPVYARRRAAPP